MPIAFWKQGHQHKFLLYLLHSDSCREAWVGVAWIILGVWHLVVDTGRKESENFRENGNEPMLEEQMTYEAEPRSIVVLMGKMHPELEEESKARRTRREKHKNKVSTTKGQTP